MRTSFSRIFTIKPDVYGTWIDKLFLTFDIDWAHDEILGDVVNLINEANVPATWFVTHETPILDDIRAIPLQELGIHPNFNPLLEGVAENGLRSKEIVEALMDFVPEAKSVRSHSLTQSSRLLDLFHACGLTHEANHLIPQHTNIELRPWLLWNQLCTVPHFWEDDVHIVYESTGTSQKAPAELIKKRGLKVFDFHPIHVFLNTESLDRYERTRHLHHNPKELVKHRFEGYGTRNRLIELLDLAKKT